MTTPRGSGQTVSRSATGTRYSLEKKKNNYYKNVYETLRVIEVVFYIKYDQQENLHQVWSN